VLFVGDDWAEEHHDIEVQDETGKVLAKKRLPEGLVGMVAFHELLGKHVPTSWADLDPAEAAGRVVVGIETDRGPWVAALVAAGYRVYAINPTSASRYRQRHSMSGAKADTTDAHLLAEIVRVDRAHHRPVAGDSADAQAVKVVARMHQTLIWDRTRHLLRLRSALREYFPAAIRAFDELAAPDALGLLAAAPDPDSAAKLTKTRIMAALKSAHRRKVDERATAMMQVLRAPELRLPAPVQQAYAAGITSLVAVLVVLNRQIDELSVVVGDHFGRHRDAEIYTSLPGLGVVLGARVLGEFGDDPHRYADAKARKAYAGTAPITRASGKKKVVLARYARNDRLADALQQWAFGSMRGSPGAKAYYQALKDRKIGHQAALRQLGNRWVGILHGCLKTGQLYNENTAWGHHSSAAA
jgi:transposase